MSKQDISDAIDETLANKKIEIAFTITQLWGVLVAVVIPTIVAVWLASAIWRNLSEDLRQLKQGQIETRAALASNDAAFSLLKEETIRAIPDRFTAADFNSFATWMNMNGATPRIPYAFELRK